MTEPEQAGRERAAEGRESAVPSRRNSGGGRNPSVGVEARPRDTREKMRGVLRRALVGERLLAHEAEKVRAKDVSA